MFFRNIAMALVLVCSSLPVFAQHIYQCPHTMEVAPCPAPPAVSCPAPCPEPAASCPAPLAAPCPDGSVAHHGFGMGMWGMPSEREIDRSMGILQQTLSLTAGQFANIRQLALSRRETFGGIRENARPKSEELRTLLSQPAPDPAQVGNVVLDLKKIREQARSAQADFNAQLMAQLNPDQQQIVNTLRDQAQTFYALRRLGLLGVPEMRRGMPPLSMLSQPGEEP